MEKKYIGSWVKINQDVIKSVKLLMSRRLQIVFIDGQLKTCTKLLMKVQRLYVCTKG